MNDIFLGQKLKEINYQINEDVDEFSTTIEELIDDYSVEDVLETIAAICSDKAYHNYAVSGDDDPGALRWEEISEKLRQFIDKNKPLLQAGRVE